MDLKDETQKAPRMLEILSYVPNQSEREVAGGHLSRLHVGILGLRR